MPRDWTASECLACLHSIFCIIRKNGGELCLLWPRSKPASSGRGAQTSRPDGDSSPRERARHARTRPAPPGCPGARCPPPTPGAAGPGRERVASQSPVGTLGPSPKPRAPGANTLAALPSRTAGARTLYLAPPPLPPPQGPQRRGLGAAKRPGRAGSRRKDARALGGSKVIKGKEPAAGGSGRFSCSRRCCFVFALLEGRSVVGRWCRPQ